MNNTDLDKEFKAHIHPRVFWDCRFEELDIEKDKIFIIGRVLMRGTDKEIRFIEDNFSLQEIKEAVEKSTEVDDICVNYYTKLYLYESRRKQSSRSTFPAGASLQLVPNSKFIISPIHPLSSPYLP